jgi:hypothetical protein
MRASRTSGSRSGRWKPSTVELLRHRRTKGPATDRLHLNHRATSRLYTMRLHDPGRNRPQVRGLGVAWKQGAMIADESVVTSTATADSRLAISERNAVIGGLLRIGLSRWLDRILRGRPFSLLVLALLSLGLLAFLVLHHLLNGTDVVRSLFPEPLEVQLFDVLRQWNLPQFLSVIGHASQLLGVHPEFSCHLNVGMGKVEPLSGIDPCLKFGRQLLLLGHSVTLYMENHLFRLLPTPAGQLFQTGIGISSAQVTKGGNPCHLCLTRPRCPTFPAIDGLTGHAMSLP